ncbi:hypothetical protein I7I53_08059 [Histoplasma capsulatum var. duboisii H88]|uniref:Uncharacterized protein n=1 Tax=Ajellomyces capsulatus (strain H88) TaxID=544711 RepID=A0A8A1LFW4_AJEC8|nr:hypothetical protein I7I53_08059 [Histoplasma capsulatum var. duboisii H88]
MAFNYFVAYACNSLMVLTIESVRIVSKIIPTRVYFQKLRSSERH